jgi:hypothetical protein
MIRLDLINFSNFGGFVFDLGLCSFVLLKGKVDELVVRFTELIEGD